MKTDDIMGGVTIGRVRKPKWIDIEKGECESGYLCNMGSKVIAEMNKQGLSAAAKSVKDYDSGEMVEDTRLIEVHGTSNMLRGYKFEIKLGMNDNAYRYNHENPLYPFSYDMKKRLEPFTAEVTGEINSDLAQRIVAIINNVFAKEQAAVIVTCLRQ